jgi:hypothetical protein
MAFIDDVLDNLAATVANVLAPFQPSIPPNYVNLTTTAGQIPATLVTPGHPIQVKVTERLENHMAQVAVYSGKVEQLVPFIDNYDSIPVVGQTNQAVYEVGRSKKQVIVEVWSYDRATRRAIQDRIRAGLTDFFRQTETDTTVTAVTFSNILEFDDEQTDSIYIAQMSYMADFTVTQVPQGDATAAYTVSEVDLYAALDSQPLGLLLVNKGGN